MNRHIGCAKATLRVLIHALALRQGMAPGEVEDLCIYGDNLINSLAAGIAQGPDPDEIEQERRLRARPRLRGYDHEMGD